MRSEKTKCIDIRKLEQENRKIFFLGYVIGALFIALLNPIFKPGNNTYTSTVRDAKHEKKKSIRAYLISIPPRTEISALPTIETEKKEPPAVEREKTADIPPDTLEDIESKDEIVSILRQPAAPPAKFPDLTGKNNIPRHEISVPETIRMPESWAMFQKPKPKPTEAIPVEKVEDKRREIKNDIFGFYFNGIENLPILLVRNAPNFIKWKIRDIFKKRRIKKMLSAKFATISTKDLRLMIIVWRNGLLNTHTLSKSDREFINAASTGDSEIMTHDAYLLKMEKRGL